MTIEEFLDENVYNLTPEEYNAAVDDLERLDVKSWVNKYAPLMMEKTAGWNDVAEVKQAKPLAERLASAFKDVKFAPGASYLNDVYASDFSDVPREQFDENLAKMKQYYDAEVKAQNDAYLKELRKREVKDWLLKGILTSDYEKQRYIDDPESALFGKQAPSLGSAKNTRWGSLADLGLGTAGAAADMIPGWGGVLAGPGIRAVRDVAHKVSDSPYQKDWKDIAVDVGADMGLSAGTAFLPNFRTQIRMGNNGLFPKKVMENIKFFDDADESLGQIVNLRNIIGQEGKPKDVIVGELKDAYYALPDGYVKQMLAGEFGKSKVNLNNVNRLLLHEGTSIRNSVLGFEDIKKALNEGTFSGTMSTTKNGGTPTVEAIRDNNAPDFPLTPWLKRVEALPTLTPFEENVVMPVVDKASKVLTTNTGNMVLQAIKTGSGVRSPKAAKRVRTDEEQEHINAIKDSEARFWEAGFKPNKVPGDPLWEAYSEWDADKRRKDAIKNSLISGRN